MAGMSYDISEGAFVSTVLQNGNAADVSKPSLSSGTTGSDAIASSISAGISYSTTGSISVSSGSSAGTAIVSDAAPYESSSIVTDLAFPAQNAFNPPIYNSSYSNGDIIASANGTSFTVSSLKTGSVLISGTTPYPIRGVRLTSTMLYLTMPESNSLVTCRCSFLNNLKGARGDTLRPISFGVKNEESDRAVRILDFLSRNRITRAAGKPI